MSYTDPGSMPPQMPVPIRPLPYSMPFQHGRPGIISAIGILCIVVASLSGMASFVTGVYSFGFYMMSKAVSAMSAASAGPIATAGPVSPVTSAVSDPLPPGDVGVAVNTLTPMLSLDSAHVRELDRLLRLHGRAVFAGDDDKRLTAASIQSDITAELKQTDSLDQTARFSTPEGTVTVNTDGADFVATDGTTRITTSARHQRNQTSSGVTVANSTVRVRGFPSAGGFSSPGTTLTPAQVTQVIGAVQTSSGNALNAAQIQSVRTSISVPNQSLVIAGSTTPVLSSFVQPGGNATITFDTGRMLILGPQGQIISSGVPAMPKFNVNGGLVAILICEAICSIALAIYLLVVGILVFRASFRAQRLLRIYAWLKIPLALVTGIGLSIFGYQLASGIANNPAMGGTSAGTAPVATSFIVWGVVMALLGLALPIGLLFALRSRTVNDYYNATMSGN
jgi:hypothetical protein